MSEYWVTLDEGKPTEPGRYEIKWRPQTNIKAAFLDHTTPPQYGDVEVIEVQSHMGRRVSGEPVWIWDGNRDIPCLFYAVEAWRPVP